MFFLSTLVAVNVVLILRDMGKSGNAWVKVIGLCLQAWVIAVFFYKSFLQGWLQ